MLIIIILTIAAVSVLLSFLSLRNITDRKEIIQVKKTLSKGKVLYHKDLNRSYTSSSSGSDSSAK